MSGQWNVKEVMHVMFHLGLNDILPICQSSLLCLNDHGGREFQMVYLQNGTWNECMSEKSIFIVSGH